MSFFIPYKSSSKDTLVKVLSTCERLEGKQPIYEEKFEIYNPEKDFNRIDLILEHRRMIQNDKLIANESGHKFSATMTPPLKQGKVTSMIGLKPVYLKDMDSTKDYLLEGCVLRCTIIDAPVKMTAFVFIIEDDYKCVERLSIYNASIDLLRKYDIGSILHIINPYMRIAADGKPMIRVDDPNTIILGPKKSDMCRFCGIENSTKSCSRCMVAKYCSKDCQVKDWEILNHKAVCFDSKYEQSFNF